jgi:hypothetical protein
MHISPFFQELRSAYQAELDDLSFDSEGQHVLHKRLAEKRQAMTFLLQMMDLNPEMVAVVLHQAFQFNAPAVMEHLLTRDADELLSWDELSDSLDMAPWAQPIVQAALNEPTGAWFLTVAAALEYMHQKPMGAGARTATVGSDDDDSERSDSGPEDEEERAAREREEVGNAWMVEQGFDSKE